MYLYFRSNFKEIIYDFHDFDSYNSDMKVLFEEFERDLEGKQYQQK